MSDRKDVELKLHRVDAWVSAEFDRLQEALFAVDCEATDVSGPGRCFMASGQLVMRIDPKIKHLALGFPERLREEIDALTGDVRPQQGMAWLNYDPDVCDQDTLDALLELALEGARSPRGPVPTREAAERVGHPRPGRVNNDDADLGLILAVLAAFRNHELMTGAPSSVKVLREAIFFRWEAPRLPRGGKLSPQLPHSSDARALRASQRANDNSGLIHEHVYPINLVIRDLLQHPPEDTTQLRARLEAHPERVIITKAEDARLSAAGLGHRAPDHADVWSRYRAVGIDPEDFAPWDGVRQA